ncbi:hypothetical protein EMIT0P176_320028 [Pseudomonas sp. IT-P176]
MLCKPTLRQSLIGEAGEAMAEENKNNSTHPVCQEPTHEYPLQHSPRQCQCHGRRFHALVCPG